MNSNPCACCGKVIFKTLLEFPRVPLTGLFYNSLDLVLSKFDLRFELCFNCGLVRQNYFNGLRDYADVKRSTARQFPAYVHSLICKLKEVDFGSEDLILEVGSNDGMLMTALRDAGFNRLLGVEPSQQLASTAREKGHNVICDYFDPELVPSLLKDYGPIRAVICRHTLEHVPRPDTFIAALAMCLETDDSLLLIEVPDGSAIPDLLNVYEFWDEHLFCFSKYNLVRLLQRSGLEVLDTSIQPHLETRNLLAWCKKAKVFDVQPNEYKDLDCVEMWQSLPDRWNIFKQSLTHALLNLSGPIYVIGASHSQTNFVNYTGIGKDVDFFIDDDPAKVGLFPPVNDIRNPIISTVEFESTADCGTLLLTGYGYKNWTEKLCSIAKAKGIKILDPKDFILNY
jgi:hypothetical protein